MNTVRYEWYRYGNTMYVKLWGVIAFSGNNPILHTKNTTGIYIYSLTLGNNSERAVLSSSAPTFLS